MLFKEFQKKIKSMIDDFEVEDKGISVHIKEY